MVNNIFTFADNNANQNTFDINIENMNMNMLGGRKRRNSRDVWLSSLKWTSLFPKPTNGKQKVLTTFFYFGMADFLDLSGQELLDLIKCS